MESSRKKNLFSQEASVLRKAQDVLEKEGVTDSEIKDGVCELMQFLRRTFRPKQVNHKS